MLAEVIPWIHPFLPLWMSFFSILSCLEQCLFDGMEEYNIYFNSLNAATFIQMAIIPRPTLRKWKFSVKIWRNMFLKRQDTFWNWIGWGFLLLFLLNKQLGSRWEVKNMYFFKLFFMHCIFSVLGGKFGEKKKHSALCKNNTAEVAIAFIDRDCFDRNRTLDLNFLCKILESIIYLKFQIQMWS